MLKKTFAFLAVFMILAVNLSVVTFAAKVDTCTAAGMAEPKDGTQNYPDLLPEVKNIFRQDEYALCPGGNFQYGASVRKTTGTAPAVTKVYNVFLKERPEVQDVSVRMNDDGTLDVFGMGKGDTNQWNNLFLKYRTIIVGISGIGAITCIVFFIINFLKLGASAGNPQARSQALTGLLWTGLAAAGLGAVTIIAGFFYNAV